MNSIDDQLNSLFEKWRKGHVTFTCDGLVYKDSAFIKEHYGIENYSIEDEWRKSTRRIMFILKDKPTNSDDDLRFWLKNVEEKDNSRRKDNRELTGTCGDGGRRTQFFPNLARMMWGLYNAQTPDDCDSRAAFSKHDEVVRFVNTIPFALVEGKKLSGTTTISDSELKAYLDKHSDLLGEEINILNPNIIVCTGSAINPTYRQVMSFLNTKYPNEMIRHGRMCIFPHAKILVISTWHPSARFRSPEAIYTHIMEVFREFLQSECSAGFFDPLQK